MTYKELKEIFTKNNIPENAQLMSDSGWECCATDMDGIYYNKESNTIVFRRNISKYESHYTKENGWIALSKLSYKTSYKTDKKDFIFDEDEFEVFCEYKGYTILEARLNPHNAEYCIQQLGLKQRWTNIKKCKEYIKDVLNKEDFE